MFWHDKRGLWNSFYFPLFRSNNLQQVFDWSFIRYKENYIVELASHLPEPYNLDFIISCLKNCCGPFKNPDSQGSGFAADVTVYLPDTRNKNIPGTSNMKNLFFHEETYSWY